MIGHGLKIGLPKIRRREWPWGDQFAFGVTRTTYSGADPRVTIHNCWFQLGANAPVACADTTVTLSYATNYVYARYQHGTQALTIQCAGTAPDYTDSSYAFKPLYEFDVTSGDITAWRERINAWQIPARSGNA